MKICIKCNIAKDTNKFYIGSHICKECHCEMCKTQENNNKIKNQNIDPYIDQTKTKICYNCKKVKLIIYFVRSLSTFDGLATLCKSCKHTRRNQYKENYKKITDPYCDITKNKICKTCKLELQITNFGINNNYSDRLNTECNTCTNIANKVVRKNRKEKNQNIDPYNKINNTKICSTCKIEKSINNFSKSIVSPGGLRYSCKECDKISFNNRYERYKNENMNTDPYQDPNKLKICSQCKEEKLITNFLANISRPGGINSVCKECCSNNDKNKRKTNNLYNLRRLISRQVNFMLKNNKSSKDRKSCIDYLPFTIQELKDHLALQFEPWMTWENHGKYNYKTWNDDDPTTWTWQLDHIIPQTRLPYSSMEEYNFRQVWSLKNLQPLASKENIIKGNKLKYKRINGDNVDNTDLYNFIVKEGKRNNDIGE
jgi:hypothetical protein